MIYTEIFSYKDNRFVLAKHVHVIGSSADSAVIPSWELSYLEEATAVLE
jgi:hypothetical protein